METPSHRENSIVLVNGDRLSFLVQALVYAVYIQTLHIDCIGWYVHRCIDVH